MKRNIFLLLALPILFQMCVKPEMCHKGLSFTNKSDTTINVARVLGSGDGIHYFLSGCPISPDTSVFILMLKRNCLEDLLANDNLDDETTLYSRIFYFYHGNPKFIETTDIDSIGILYNVVKTFDLQNADVDSLVKTNFTVYYP